MEISETSCLVDYGHTFVIYPLTMEILFHPQSNANSKVDVHRIVVSSSSPIVHSVSTYANLAPFFYFRAIIWKTSRETNKFEMAMLHDMRAIVPKGMIGHVYRS